MIRMEVLIERSYEHFPELVSLLFGGDSIWGWSGAVAVDRKVSFEEESVQGHSHIVDVTDRTWGTHQSKVRQTKDDTYRSQTQTSALGRMQYRASVLKPMIHGPGS